MSKIFAFFLGIILTPVCAFGETMGEVNIALPQPSHKGIVSVEESIKGRRTIRGFGNRPLTMAQVSQLLWAAQGITDKAKGFRSAPSAGALYPLDLYVVAGKNGVGKIEEGVYMYSPHKNSLLRIAGGDRRKSVARVALGQDWMSHAPVIFVITAQYNRITGKYGDRGVRYAHIETGHVGQNIFLQAEALGLSAGIVGAFHDDALSRTICAMPDHEPLLIMPVGYRK